MNKNRADTQCANSDWKMIGVRVPPELIKAVKQYALDKDLSMQDVTIDALKDFLKRNGVKIP